MQIFRGTCRLSDRLSEGGNVISEIDIETYARERASGATTIDVRVVHEYDEAHVPGAILVPLGEFADGVADLPGDPLLIICRSGARSLRACEMAAAAGREAINVGGGTLAWIASGRETVSGPERG